MVPKPYTLRAGSSSEYATLRYQDASGEGPACLSLLQRSTSRVRALSAEIGADDFRPWHISEVLLGLLDVRL